MLKILYAVQATGNGHISRAIELMPLLQQYGKVDVFLSGNNSSLSMPFEVKYKSIGLSLFYGNTGSLDYFKMLTAFQPYRIYKEAQQLPLEKYDIVINDFESITSLACKLKNKPCVHFGHQASFQSKHTPRPKQKDIIGEWVLKNYANGNLNIGLHFDNYDDFIFSPILKDCIVNAQPNKQNHITVYLSHYSDEVLTNALGKIKDVRFEVFSKKAKSIEIKNNITFIPVNNELFTKSMINSLGVITGAGFETPAEALYLEKKLLCLPIKGQYEQSCNAAALQQFNVPILQQIDEYCITHIHQWLQMDAPKKLLLHQSSQQIIEQVIHQGLSLTNNKSINTIQNAYHSHSFFEIQNQPLYT